MELAKVGTSDIVAAFKTSCDAIAVRLTAVSTSLPIFLNVTDTEMMECDLSDEANALIGNLRPAQSVIAYMALLSLRLDT